MAIPQSVAASHEWLAEDTERLVWLGLYRPEPGELEELAEQYDLPELAVGDAI